MSRPSAYGRAPARGPAPTPSSTRQSSVPTASSTRPTPSNRSASKSLTPKPAPTGTAAKLGGGQQGGYRVFSSTQEEDDDIGIQTLLGEYVERGMNHGRKFYQKTQKIEGHEDMSVFLYYWDGRDGPDFSGWWFGDKVGGTQVWSRADSESMSPPARGWRIPWDGPVTDHLLGLEPLGGDAEPSLHPAPPPRPRPQGAPSQSAGRASSGAPASPEAVQASAQAAEVALDEAEQVIAASAEAAEAANATASSVAEAGKQIELQRVSFAQSQKDLAAAISSAKAGAAPASLLAEMLKLSTRMRSVQGNLAQAAEQMKKRLTKVQKNADEERKRSEADQRVQRAEQRDARAFQDALPAVVDLVAQAEDAVEMVSIMAKPLSAEEDWDETESQTLRDVEEAAKKAAAALAEAKALIQKRLNEAKDYSAHARRVAQQELQALMDRVNNAGKALNPLKKCRAEFEQRREAKKAILEVSDRLGGAELEVEKAHIQANSRSEGQMSEEEIKALEAQLQPAAAAIEDAQRLLDRRLGSTAPGVGAPAKELEGMKSRIKQAKAKLDGVRSEVRRQRDGITTQKLLHTAHERVEHAEELLVKAAEAEMPFLRGVENLSMNEALKVVGQCEEAGNKTEAALDLARAFIKTKLADAKSRLSKSISSKVLDELTELQKRAEGAAKKLTTFKKETAQRKTRVKLRDALEKVEQAEAQVNTLAEVVKNFESEKLEITHTESLTSICEQAAVAEKDATAACQEARHLLSAKQKDAKEPALVSELSKLQARLNNTQTDLSSQKKAALNGERMREGKQKLIEEDERMKVVEDQVAVAETLATPLGDDKPSDDAISKIEKAVNRAQASLNAAIKSVDNKMPGAIAPLKAALSKVLVRGKKAQAALDAVKASTREQRERVACDSFIQEARAKADATEAALVKVSDAELPFLKGVEVLPKDEADASIEASEKAAEEAQKTISDARSYVASKTLEVRKFAEGVSKTTLEELQSLTERVNAASQKLNNFRKETEGRRRSSLVHQGDGKIADLETKAEERAAAAAPLASNLENMSNEEAAGVCSKLGAMDKDAEAMLDKVRRFLNTVEGQVKGHNAQEEQLKKLRTRLKAVEADLAKSKKATTESEQRFVAKKLVSEASAMVTEVDAEIAKVQASSEKLLKSGGAALLAEGRAGVLASALRAHMKKHESTTEDTLCEKLTNGGTADQATFKAFVQGLSEVPGSEDLFFPAEHLESVFKHLDADGDGQISAGDFKSLFRELFTCVHATLVTDSAVISGSKTVCKLEIGDIVEALGPAEQPQASGVTRLRCRVPHTEKEGWVTLRGNQGTRYLEALTPFVSYVRPLDRSVETCSKNVNRAHEFVKQKGKDISGMNEGPLFEARGELVKLHPRMSTASFKFQELKRKIEEAKAKYTKLEEADKQALQDERDRRASHAALSAVAAKVQALEETLQRQEEALAPLLSASPSDLEVVASPSSALEAGAQLETEVTASAATAKECAKEHQPGLLRENKGPLSVARQALGKLQGRIDAAAKKSAEIMVDARTRCHTIAQAALEKVVASLRAEVQKREVTMDVLFSELAPEGADRITEDAFCQRVSQLSDCSLTPEQALLVCRRIEQNGISRRAFLGNLQQFFVCVKQIAITDDFEISKGKTLRMLEADEVVEVIEGPSSDNKLGLTRVRARALSDSFIGWLTIKGGRSGKDFLKETVKPFITCTGVTPMEQEFRSASSAVVRTLKDGEVLEVLEGPRQERLGAALRCSGKACRDGIAGWFSVKDRDGETNAEIRDKYFLCLHSIAITDVQDIRKCKVVRKLNVNEVVRCVEGPVDCDPAGVTRIKVCSVKDQIEGWVTVKGNAGTVYVQESDKHYTVIRETPMQKSFPSDSSSQIRMLAKDEAVEVTEGPKEEKVEPVIRVKGKSLNDGAVGWVTIQERAVKSWSPIYKVVHGTLMQADMPVKGSKVVRRLEVGEKVEAIEGPMEEPGTGIMRVRGRAEKDGAIGWISVKGLQGRVFLECKVR